MTSCQSADCGGRADVSVERVSGPTTCVCWKHLLRILLDPRHEVRGFRRLDWAPQCFQATCTEVAVAVAHNAEDLPLPVCREHFDALSWVDLRGPLLTDEPGWSRG